MIGQLQFFQLQDYGFCKDIHHSSILKLAFEKAIQNSTNANLSSKLFQYDSNYQKNQFVGFVSSHKTGTLLTSFHIHSLLVFHTDLQKNTIVTCILTERNHILTNMQDWLLEIMQLIQYPHVSSFSTVITNEFIGGDFYLSQHSMNGYKAMGFDVTQLTQEEGQSVFTIKTNMPIPVLVYGDAFQWAKYGHHILPSNLDLTSHHKLGSHQLFWNYLIDFLCTDLGRNVVPSSLDLTSHNKAGLHQTF